MRLISSSLTWSKSRSREFLWNLFTFFLFWSVRDKVFCIQAVTHRHRHAQRRFYTQNLLHTNGFSIQTLQTRQHPQSYPHIFFAHKHLYVVTHRWFRARVLCCTLFFPHQDLLAQRSLHTKVFKHTRPHTQICLPTAAFGHIFFSCLHKKQNNFFE